jgi:hypothetical protein
MPELLLSEPPHPARTATARMVPAVVAALVRMVGPLWKFADWKSSVPYPAATIARGQDGFRVASGPEGARNGPRNTKRPAFADLSEA